MTKSAYAYLAALTVAAPHIPDMLAFVGFAVLFACGLVADVRKEA